MEAPRPADPLSRKAGGYLEASGEGPMHVVIAGGGVAGLEALLALSTLAEGLVDVELVSPESEFVYRPLLVAEPFGVAEALRLELKRIVGDVGARHTEDALASIDPGKGSITTSSGKTIAYDALLLALGAKPVEAVPGAISFGDQSERRRFTSLLRDLGRKRTRRIAFVVPRAVSWSIAAYELALLTAAECRERDLYGVEITLVTHESSPLEVFGPAASQLVAARLDEARIALRTSAVADRVSDGRLMIDGGEALDVDAAVALPALEVPPLAGVPQRQGGFIETDTAMHVSGLEKVWAAGDATWFPIKQGGLATQQSDVAARSIAARAGAHVPIEAFQPVLRAALLTGDAPDFLRSARANPGAATAEAGALWAPAMKLAGKYLGPYIATTLGEDSPVELVDVEPSADPTAVAGAHEHAVALLLTSADADARSGDFEGALGWLSLVEQLNLAIPPGYVVKRHEWRERLDPDLGSDLAAERIDPSLAGAEEAIWDLQRRVGWLREIELRAEENGERQLAGLDQGMAHLVALCRRTGALQGSRDDQDREHE